MKDWDTMTISKVGQSTLPKWWRDASGLSEGGVVEVRSAKDGRNSIILTPQKRKRHGAVGTVRQDSSPITGGGPSHIAVEMSFLIDTDLLSLLQPKRVPVKLLDWVEANEDEIFLSVVSLAELQFGVNKALKGHQPELIVWLDETKRQFASATEPLTESVLVRWKELLKDLKQKNRTMTCEDSLIAATALFNGHTVATQNTRHFEPAGVNLMNPAG